MARRRTNECPDCGGKGKHTKKCPQLRQSLIPGASVSVRVVPVESRHLADFGPTSAVWEGASAAPEEGSIVRVRPPPGTPPEVIARVLDEVEKAGARAIKVVPPSRAMVIPTEKNEAPRTARAQARDVVMQLVDEANTQDRDALRGVVDHAMGKAGL